MRWYLLLIAFSLVFMLYSPTQGYRAIIDGQKEDGQILYVGGSGPGNYTTIQGAIHDAQPGDTIYVYHKIYNENVLVDKAITLIGEKRDSTFIDGTSALTLTANGISVRGFTIRNEGGFRVDITLVVVCSNSSIANCTVQTTTGIAMRLESASNNTFFNCSFQGNPEWGGRDTITTWYAINNSFRQCEISDSYRYGISLHGTGNSFSNCDISNNGEAGIRMDGSRQTFSNCLFHDNGIGLEIDESRDHVINDCRFYQNNIGIRLWQYAPINVTVTNCDIYDNANSGIEIIQVTQKSTIRQCRIFDNGIGIAFGDRCQYNSIQNCSVYNNSEGISIADYCNDNTISNCYIYNNDQIGLFLDGCSNNTIQHCLLAENGNGTYIGRNCNYNTLYSCQIVNNRNYGLHMNGPSISNEGNAITYCRFQGNPNWDIRIEGYCFNNMIHHNIFSDQVKDVHDTCSDYWDDGHEGNYYARYRGKDQNGDGIGDTSYHVGAYNFDRYPLMGSIPSDPHVQITSPLKGFLYVRNQKILPLFITTVIIGPINITASASSNSSGIKQIDFYMDSVLIGTDTTVPYYLQWDETKLFRHTLTVVAYNNAGNTSMDERIFWTL